MYETYHSGWIECITGSMFSGKSEELIRRLRRGIYAKQKVIVFKPAIDDRYHKEKVVSHDGNELEAINISTAREIQAVCAVCGSSSSRTQRLIDGQPARIDDPIILVGANESYEPRCRAHHIVAPSINDKEEI